VRSQRAAVRHELDAYLRDRRSVAHELSVPIDEGSIKKEQHVELLKALRAHLQQPLPIIWDGL
jgi:hypothetical protein